MEKNKTELNFRPLTEGLGFHPFSNGLPYAPVGKNQPQPGPPSRVANPSPRPNPGAGATAAGVPLFVGTAKATPKISVPVATHVRLPRSEQSASSPSEEFKAKLEAEFGFEYLLKRCFAFILDSLINLSLCVVSLSGTLWKQDLNPDLLLNPGVVLVSSLFLLFFNWALITAQEIVFGTSLSKRIFGLVLRGGTTAVFLRAFFFIPSIGFCGLGILWALIDSKKRCWHDLVVDLQPTEIARL